jgi:hypothetical protein
MSKRLIISIWLSSLFVGLLVAIPTTSNFIDHWRAKKYAEQGCEKFRLVSIKSPGVKDSEIRAIWSEAARLNPEYLLLASSSQTVLVGRELARTAGYEQQWLEGLQVIYGFCDFAINPQVSKN